MIKLLVRAVALACIGVCCSAQPGLYCGEKDCYTLLNLDRWESPSTAEIKKRYRALSRKLHPDRNPGDPEAANKFAEIAVAYETLVDPETRENYHYFRDNPNDYMGNYMRAYKPKSDSRLVIAMFVISSTGLHWILMIYQYKRGKELVKQYNPKFKETVQARAKAQLQQQQQQASSHPNGGKKAHKRSGGADKKAKKAAQAAEQAALAQLEKEIADELIDQVDLEGSYRKPAIKDLWVVKLGKAPFYLFSSARWYYKHTIKGEPLTREEKLLLLKDALGMSEEMMRIEYPGEEFEQLFSMECWISANHQRLQEIKFQKSNPGFYKKYKRYMKNRPPPTMEMD